jgi:DNA-binding transcriptional LysR family regulator
LDVGQPAVSKAIAQLEERLQTRLLLRSTRGLTTTEAGQAYYESARRAIAMVDEADGAARGVSADLVGKLRICAAVTFARLHVIPHIKRFLDRHPALEIEVMLDDRQIDLLENGIDVALRMGDLGDSSMTARRIATGRRMVVAAPAYLAERGVPQVPTELAQHEAVVYLSDSGGAATWSFERDSTELSINVNGRVRVNAAEGVRAAVCAGVGVAIVSEWMFAPELASGAVEQLLPEWNLPTIDLWAVYPSGRLTSAKARAFTAFVQEVMAGTETAATAPE